LTWQKPNESKRIERGRDQAARPNEVFKTAALNHSATLPD
jgi:hypothetical protein